jgi:trimeric autotransporter adhesin
MRRLGGVGVFLGFVIASMSSAQIPVISLGMQTLQPDGTTAIPIQIASSGNPPAAIQIDLQYNNAVAKLTPSAGASVTAASMSLYSTNVSPNVKRILIAGLNGNTIPDGALANLVLAPVQSGGTGPYAISFSNIVASSLSGSNFLVSGSALTGALVATNSAILGQAAQAVAPGELVTLWISGLLPAGALASNLAVTFNGTAAPLLYTSLNQIDAVTPFELAGQGNAQIGLYYQSQQVFLGSIAVAVSEPGIFSVNGLGSGQAIIMNQDGTLNSASNPAPRGSIAAMFGTGFGAMNPGLGDGVIAPLSPTPTNTPVASVAVEVGGNAATIVYNGPAPGAIAGLMQVNFIVPAAASPGAAVMLQVQAGGNFSPANLTMAVQ